MPNLILFTKYPWNILLLALIGARRSEQVCGMLDRSPLVAAGRAPRTLVLRRASSRTRHERVWRAHARAGPAIAVDSCYAFAAGVLGARALAVPEASPRP
jgi:hypothetical protein